MDPPAFGSPMREEFNLEPGIAFINQGSYGHVPNRVMAKYRDMEDLCERDFDEWFRLGRFKLLAEMKDKVGPYFGIGAENFSFVENTTRGISNVMKRLPWTSGDAILYNNWTYSAIQDLIDETMAMYPGVTKIQMDHLIPIANEEQILQQYEQALQQNPSIKLAVVDHISSSPCVLFPVEAITALCHQYGVWVLIDGAHTPGQIPLNVEQIGADFYVGNLYKWLFSARGCAIQWVDPKHQSIVFPAVTSFDVERSFPENTFNQGTRNDVSYAVADAATEFFQWVGGLTAVQAYCEPMIATAADEMAAAFGTERLNIPASMEPPLLKNIVLPTLPGFDPADPLMLMYYLREEYSIWVAVSYIPLSDIWFARLSGSIFCTPADYTRLTDAIREIMEGKLNKKAVDTAKKNATINRNL